MYTNNGFKIARALIWLGIFWILLIVFFPALLAFAPRLPRLEPASFIYGGFVCIMSGVFLGVLCEISEKLDNKSTKGAEK